MIDAIVVGGSFAGLSAALYLGRGRHEAVVLDTATPRNRFSPHSHGFFTRDGTPPAEMVRLAHGQLAAYPTVTLREAEATDAHAIDDGFAVTLASGETVEARRLLLATGMHDTLPDIPGLAERWGKSVIHCPYCHGYEYAGRQLGVLYAGAGSVEHARMIAHWGPTTLLLNGASDLAGQDVEALRARGVATRPQPIRTLCGAGDTLARVDFSDGSDLALDALYVAPKSAIRGSLHTALGLAMRETPLGEIVAVDEMMMTSRRGVFAAGDIARIPPLALRAAADGAFAGTMISRSLILGWPE